MSKLFEEMMSGLDEVETFLAGRGAGYRVSVPKDVDVRAIRKMLSMTQEAFSGAFGFSLDAVKHWEGGRRTPEAAARAFLTVIARDPAAMMAALHLKKAAKSKSVRRVAKPRGVARTA